MTRINLLPWRDERRAELKREFLIVLGIAVATGAAIIFVVDLFFNGQIQNQNNRNDYLSGHIDALSEQVEEIQDMQRTRRQLLDRIEVIQELQGNRPVIVHVLDQLVQTVPEGVFYTELAVTDEVIAITGIAESNSRISSLMRRLDSSEWFRDPDLEGVKAEPNFGEQANTFNMTVQLQLPSADAG